MVRELRDAGVVDQNIDPAEALRRSLRKAATVTILADIRPKRKGVDPEAATLRCDSLSRIGA
jgi:hypothetical protein